MTHDDLRRAEYEALRATIRERGTMRMWVIVVGVATWGLILALETWHSTGLAPLISLAIVFATFEVNVFVHTGVERIGRYIQVFHEEASSIAAWETTAMTYGAGGATSAHPLLTSVFHVATFMNFLGTTSTLSLSILVLLPAHLVLTYRIVSAARQAKTTRASDLQRFRTLAASGSITFNQPSSDLQ